MRAYTNSLFYEYGEETALVAYSFLPGSPVSKWGHPDSWSPAEGDEIDLLRISVNGEELEGAKLAAFLADEEDRLYRAIQNYEAAV